MKLSDSKIKKSYFFPKESICSETEPCNFEPKLKKKNLHPSQKCSYIFLYFRKWKPWKKNSLYFRKRKPYKNLFYVGKWNFSPQARKMKKKCTPKNYLTFSQTKAFLIFQETETLKNSSYLKKRHFVLFHEVTFGTKIMKQKPLLKSFLYFGEMQISSPKFKKLLTFQKELPKPASQKKFILFLIKKAKFFKLDFFLIVIIKRFFTFYHTFFYTLQAFFSSSERFF